MIVSGQYLFIIVHQPEQADLIGLNIYLRPSPKAMAAGDR